MELRYLECDFQVASSGLVDLLHMCPLPFPNAEGFLIVMRVDILSCCYFPPKVGWACHKFAQEIKHFFPPFSTHVKDFQYVKKYLIKHFLFTSTKLSQLCAFILTTPLWGPHSIILPGLYMERLNIVEVFQLIYNLRDCISYYLHYLAHAFLSCFASMGLHKPHFSFACQQVPLEGSSKAVRGRRDFCELHRTVLSKSFKQGGSTQRKSSLLHFQCLKVWNEGVGTAHSHWSQSKTTCPTRFSWLLVLPADPGTSGLIDALPLSLSSSWPDHLPAICPCLHVACTLWVHLTLCPFSSLTPVLLE